MGVIFLNNYFISGINPSQSFFTSLDDFIDDNSIVKPIKAFVDVLNLSSLGFLQKNINNFGRPPFNPKDLIALFIYGHRFGISSSRKLERLCKTNVEIMWLLGRLTPDHNVIADFRKDNFNSLHNTLLEFNKIFSNLFSHSTASLDGSKFKASNSKDNNFTKSKLDDRIKRASKKITDYLNSFDENTDEDTLNPKIADIVDRIKKYKDYQEQLKNSGESQISLSDPKSRLMKTSNGGFDVSYNIQTVVDESNHLVSNFKVTNSCNDTGFIKTMAKDYKKNLNIADNEVVTILEDGGYVDKEDIADCFKNKIIPILPESSNLDGYTFDIPFKEITVTDAMKKGTTVQDVKVCLENGIIPECYSHLNLKADVVFKRVAVDEDIKTISIFNTDEERIQKAKDGYFVKNMDDDKVFCPNGEILRKKSSNKKGIRYYNKLACKKCPHKCTVEKFKVVSFKSGQEVVSSAFKGRKTEERKEKRERKKIKYKTIKVGRFNYVPDKDLYSKRKCLSEHVFGTTKFSHNNTQLKLRGVDKITGEISLMYLAYNFVRVSNILGIDEMINTIKNYALKLNLSLSNLKKFCFHKFGLFWDFFII